MFLLSDTDLRTAAPARDISAINEVFRLVQVAPPRILFLELSPAAGAFPAVGPESARSLSLVHEHCLTLAQTCRALGATVVICSPVTSLAWRSKGTVAQLLGQEWLRYRATSPRAVGTAHSRDSWL